MDDYAVFVMEKMHSKNRDNKDYAMLGLAGEVGEVVDAWKKTYHGKDLPVEKVLEEMGDVIFYFTLVATQWGLTLDQIIEHNKEKLNARYPKGSADNGRAEGR
jgi:NTP pyrophosphatase (non-canonical NTP hydrolase)